MVVQYCQSVSLTELLNADMLTGHMYMVLNSSCAYAPEAPGYLGLRQCIACQHYPAISACVLLTSSCLHVSNKANCVKAAGV